MRRVTFPETSRGCRRCLCGGRFLDGRAGWGIWIVLRIWISVIGSVARGGWRGASRRASDEHGGWLGVVIFNMQRARWGAGGRASEQELPAF